ncbi:MAG: PorT family protein [Bacteroidales bacterium]|nr:PorT family protein [Bacteroidales bacterium]
MKRFLIIVFVFLFSVPVFSQIKFGLKAGATMADVAEYNFTDGSTTIEALKNAAWGFHAGLFLRVSLFGVYIQPEAVFASNTYEYNVTTVSATELKKQTFNKLEIPVLLGFKLGPIRINAGPAADILIGSPKALVEDSNFDELYRNATFGFQAGLGFDLLKKLTFDVRYSGSLSGKFGDAVNIGGQTFKLDHRQPSLLLSVGLIF